ncbi:hypothetical protein GQ44DRAFT_726596 [Phaeosphaeriaceae sp. PMI808]|nr:hypothetical protein GQ44DRAFT_726596 [Phaeosphaeriaceae sp. PMI808]
MHNLQVVVSSILLFASSLTDALFLPQFRLYSSQKSLSASLADKCTFTVWHKQLCQDSTKSNYVQINEIQDHANNITIDVAALRPVTARNSYTKLSATQVFAIQGLLDNGNLTVRGENNDDDIKFEYNDVTFSSNPDANGKSAWCVSEAWNQKEWQCGRNSRERKIGCTFSCGAIGEEVREDTFINELD